MHEAARNGHVKVIGLLLQQRADADGQDNGGSTALHIAAEKGHLEVVRLLLEHEADTGNMRDVYSEQPLHCAVSSVNLDIVRLLLDHGAIVDTGGTTPLQIARNMGQQKIIQLLEKEILNRKIFNVPSHRKGRIWTDRLCISVKLSKVDYRFPHHLLYEGSKETLHFF